MFVTLEGPEGGGKTTVVRALAANLEQAGRRAICTREPGSGEFGKVIRGLLLHGEDLPARTELLLFLADRSHHVERLIKPALADGSVVLCDRFADSTWVYQGFARGLDPEFVASGNAFATQGLTPDLTLLLDLPPEVGLARMDHLDRMDSQPIEFHRRVREGFLELSRRDPSRWVVLDATQSPEEIADAAIRELWIRLPGSGITGQTIEKQT